MRLRGLIPQFFVRFICGRRGHRQAVYTAHAGIDVARETGISIMVVNTCMCGDNQQVSFTDNSVQFPRRRDDA